jgi:hypothetical protein
MAQRYFNITYINSANGQLAMTVANTGVVTFANTNFNLTSTAQVRFSNTIFVKSVVANNSFGTSGQVLKSGGTNGNTYWDYYQTLYVLDNIGGQFDGQTTAYNVTVNGANLVVSDINNLFLTVGNQQYIPSAIAPDLVNIPEFIYRPTNSYTMTSNSTATTIKFSAIPTPGTTFYGRVIPSSVTGRYTASISSNNYPFQAIALAAG